MNFGDKWRKWIKFCISSTRFSVLVNERLETRGSLISYVIHFGMMDKAVSGGLLKGFDASFRGQSNVTTTHLLFADDTLVFCDVNASQLDCLRQILIWLPVSSLKINLSKYKVTTVGAANNIEEIAQVLNSKVGDLPITYLGLPLGASNKDLAV